MPRPVILQDDSSIDGGMRLLREVKPEDGSPGVDWKPTDAPRLRSGAFQLASEEHVTACGYPGLTMSFYLEAAVQKAHGSVEAWASETRRHWGFAVLTAHDLRSEGFSLHRDDLKQVDDAELMDLHISELAWGHTVAWLPTDDGGMKPKIPRGAQNRLGGRAREHGWAILPRIPQDC